MITIHNINTIPAHNGLQDVKDIMTPLSISNRKTDSDLSSVLKVLVENDIISPGHPG